MEIVTPVAVPSTLPHQANTKVAIITGASSGIGRTTSIALCAAGWRVVLSARREAELNETARLCQVAAQQAGILVAETSNAGENTENSVLEKSQDRITLVVAGDVTVEEDVRRLFDTAATVYGEWLTLKLCNMH